MPPRVSLVIPMFEEARRLPACLEALRRFRAEWREPCEVIMVVEKSSDGTLELANAALAKQEVSAVLAPDEHRGKGFAVRTGMLAATGALVFFTDVDLSVPLEEIPRFVAWLDAHPETDVLIGNRQHAGSRIEKAQSWLRRTMGQTFNRVLRRLTGIAVLDTQCGFKAFRQRAAREIFARQRVDGFAFDVEVLLLAKKLGLRVEDLPVRWINSPESKVHILRDSARMLRDAWRLRWRLTS